ncbi:MAG: hypothetical protein JST38_13175 [Bacteroidetes bacterium]|nr:hypothetical protein [Bacteroidota bacterium]
MAPPHLGKNNNHTTSNTFTTPLTPSNSFHGIVRSRCGSGVSGRPRSGGS